MKKIYRTIKVAEVEACCVSDTMQMDLIRLTIPYRNGMTNQQVKRYVERECKTQIPEGYDFIKCKVLATSECTFSMPLIDFMAYADKNDSQEVK